MDLDRVTAAVMDQGPMTSVAIVGDRQLCVAALAAHLVDADQGMLGTARGFGPVSAMLEGHRPQVLVSDGELGTRFDLAPWGGRLLVLLDPGDSDEVYRDAAAADADGYLARSASGDALRFAVDALSRIGHYIDPLLASRIVRASEEGAPQDMGVPVADPEGEAGELLPARLTLREREIVSRVALGYSSKEIARDYSLSAKTVCNHISNIYGKLKVSHRGQLVLYAVEHGLVREGNATSAVPRQVLARDY